ncbi:hypothetical protein QFC22_006286 [Naganishia vaughanmartiniae]|uniref:Uncharacterized protein n=1 Tax=Naganishia vaughanmartiniae TaxID=1424756 RepID=A0ACC2WMZ3_9TREE|nr:hypothetical protein QFC22_006286 [Naganishia vaughanmartiniae]
MRLARILYIIATTFTLPPACLATLDESLNTYTAILSTTDSPLCKIDAGFNLAVGLAQMADWVEEGLSEEHGGGKDKQVLALRERALGLLYDVAQVQEAYLAENTEQGDEGDMDRAEPADIPADGDEDEESPATYEEHVPTPSALVETFFEIVDTTTSIWASLPPSSGLDNLPTTYTPAAIDQILERCTTLAHQTGDVSLDGMVAVKRLEAALVACQYQQTLQLSPLVDRTKGAWQTAIAKDSAIDAETRLACAEVLMDVESHLVRRTQDPAQIWQHLSAATQIATASLANPPPITTSPLSGASTLLNLSTFSLRRALVSIEHPTFSPSVTHRKQLLANAEVYANRGLKELGWTAFASEAVGVGAGSKTLSIGIPSVTSSGGSIALPPATGWDRESLARNTVLALLRSLYYQSILLTQDPAAVATAQRKADKLLSQLQALRRTESQSRWLRMADVSRFADVLEEEEGTVRAEEKVFWEQLVQKLEALS